jgi:hypothetical protein
MQLGGLILHSPLQSMMYASLTSVVYVAATLLLVAAVPQADTLSVLIGSLLFHHD